MRLNRRSLLAAAGLAATPGLARGATAPTALAFRFADNQATVQISFGGKGPFRFLIDSGALHLAMDQPELAALGLKPLRVETITGAAGEARSQVYRAPQTAIGDQLVLTDQDIRGLDLGGMIDMDMPVGILPLFALGRTLTDFAAHTVTRQDAGAPPPKDMVIFPASDPVPARRGAADGVDPRPYATVMLDGRTIKVMLDTGYTGALILTSRYVRDSGLAGRFGQGPQQTLGGATGSVTASMLQVGELNFGGHAFKNQWIELNDPTQNIPGDVGYQGAIGMELIRRFDLWLDGETGAAGVRPNKLIDDVERYDRSGLDVTMAKSGEADILVMAVAKGSPADTAGLKPGDRILGFNGDGGLIDLRWTLSGPPGSQVDLILARPGGEQMVSLTLREPG